MRVIGDAAVTAIWHECWLPMIPHWVKATLIIPTSKDSLTDQPQC